MSTIWLMVNAQPDSNYILIRTKVPVVLTDSPASQYGKIAVANVSEDEIMFGASLVTGEYGKKYWHVYYDGFKGYCVDDTYFLSYPQSLRYYYESKALHGDDTRMIYAEKASIQYKKRIQATLDKIIATRTKVGLHITDWNWGYESEYSSAFDFSISFRNYSKKTVKYIWFYITAYDAVGGRLSSFGKTIVELKGIGPVIYLDGGTYDFERVFYSKVVDKVKIIKVRIQYMDGSFKDFTNIASIM